MAYTITVSNPGYLPAEEECVCTVATLDEARDFAQAAVDDHTWSDSIALNAESEAARFMPERGGTVGPLPDGTVIEIRKERP